MKQQLLACSLVAGLLPGCVDVEAGAKDPNRQLWMNGEIYTVNEQQPWADAMVIEDGTIVYVGNEAEAKKLVNANTQIHNLKGNLVLPGLHDVHLHPMEASSEEVTCILESSESVGQWLAEIKQCEKVNPSDDWLLGWGHSILTLLESTTEPRALLDNISNKRPIAIMEETSHSMWVNSVALARLKLDGKIVNQTINGGAVLLNDDQISIGVLLDGAGDLAFDMAMQETPERLERNYEALLAGLEEVNKHGITSIVDARIYWQRGYLKAWQRAEKENTLTTRSVLSLWAYPNLDDAQQLAALKTMYQNEEHSLLKVNQIKFYSDGITHNATSALLEPYKEYYDEVGPLGLNYFDETRLTKYVTQLSQVGFDAHIHAIGDRGVRESLNAIEAAQTVTGKTGRHRLTHVEMVSEQDKPRFNKLNVTADFQLAGEFTHPENFYEMEPIIGERAYHQLPVRDLYNTGANVTLSSDWDVSSLSPFVGMQNALSRGEQSLPDLKAVIEAYTINAAYVMGQEHITGSLIVGKAADFVVVDQNIFEVNVNKISQTQVLSTVLEGEIVFKK
ncbi:amidohydrolase [Bermanella sp. WJH001]|uniref:amidohydrolase n=1 Tax=Bermanella sp. WJH001 TaxID=3048005 RepID=UPI0024BEA63E|nr:amidohydrolase family protein [Bermanella sp. WJH001]MDJ1537518.1 amidohydrolase family protein [Bermanella sp. WJH001]